MDAWHIQFCCRYKGFGGMSGALLCSSRSLVSLASDWQVRLGGSVFTQAPQWIDASDLSPAGAFFSGLFVFFWYSFSSWHFPKLLWLRKIVQASPAERTLESGHSRFWAAWQYQEMSRVWMLVSLCICKIDYICTILYIGSANLCQDLPRIVCTDGLRRTVSGPRRIVSEEIC